MTLTRDAFNQFVAGLVAQPRMYNIRVEHTLDRTQDDEQHSHQLKFIVSVPISLTVDLKVHLQEGGAPLVLMSIPQSGMLVNEDIQIVAEVYSLVFQFYQKITSFLASRSSS